ncbi:tripartite tricarboxylate transporter TctB family protein [Lacisediminimonas profundi]|uniref:tripartite tricarboxylate transporter TctB family protein n=1 Tax=Lacisediminimonas profundi TaxID=2603856 RepID=UPI00124B8DA1|nr:tripartite tricarboxylate transporter TctB family protein [Lacisediminimonas profundi]
MDHHTDAGAPRSGVPTYIVEAVVAVLVLILGLTVIYGSRKLGSGWTSDGPGAGYFPFYIGLIICISGAGILWQSVFGKERNTEIFVDSEQLKRVLSVLIPAAVYVGAIQVLGLYVASAIYIALFMIILGKYSPLKSVILGIVINGFFFALFEIWFKVPLFKGMINLLSFTGY